MGDEGQRDEAARGRHGAEGQEAGRRVGGAGAWRYGAPVSRRRRIAIKRRRLGLVWSWLTSPHERHGWYRLEAFLVDAVTVW